MLPSSPFSMNSVAVNNNSAECPEGGKGMETAGLDDIVKLEAIESGNSELIETKMGTLHAVSTTSVVVIKDITRRGKINARSNEFEEFKVSDKKVSTSSILELANEKFIHSDTFLNLSDEEARDVELVKNLLVSAEEVGLHQFDRASKFLKRCDILSSVNGSHVQRLVYYFCEALRERIDQEKGRITDKGVEKNLFSDLQGALLMPNPSILAFIQKAPFSRVKEIAGIQTMLEHVRDARKVHVIDLALMSGACYRVLMKAIAAQKENSLEQLKVTAIGSTRSKSKMEDAGNQLKSFAQSISMPFTFKIITVEDMLDLNIGRFELDDQEEVVIYAPFFMSSLIPQPDRLDSVMRIIRKIRPCILVITEVEANTTSPEFMNRFKEALFYYGGLFECLADCMGDDELNRNVLESVYMGLRIRNIVSAEGEERTIQHCSFDTWRSYFTGFDMMEIQLSKAALDQSKLMLLNFECGSSCTLHMDGNGLIVGWKSMPLFSLSVWKFQ